MLTTAAHTAHATRGIVTAPHHLAAQAGLGVLRDGGNAIEAMVAAASTIAVVYPHMNAIGGDGFWLIHNSRGAPGADPVGIDACGAAGQGVDAALYRGMGAIPARGPLAANTVAGTVSGWQAALNVSSEWGGRLALGRLLEDATHYARNGFTVTGNQARNTEAKQAELADVPGFAETFLHDGRVPAEGAAMTFPRLADTLDAIATEGPDGFYRGALAARIAADLAAVGSPVTADDLAHHRARVVTPLSVRLRGGTVYNMPPPTQGLASLMILALFERLGVKEADGFDHLHGLVEATKQAFLVRNAKVTDPDYMDADAATYLTDTALDDLASRIDRTRAAPWPQPAAPGDTVWMGAIDGEGRAVSFIQSIYWEFGSGVVLPETGILWQNRGSSFSLADGAPNALVPRRRPFHTLNPALALLDDGRVMSYGTMGGEGQPQTQAALFTRYAMFGQDLQAAITAPRWLLGRTWGDETTTLKLEDRFDPALVQSLRDAGHLVEVVEPFSDLMGHAGAVVRHADGRLDGATDPRSDGGVAGY